MGLEQDPSLLGALMKAVDTALFDHFDSRRIERRRELIAEWKTRQSYPYHNEPATDEERVERAAFDVIATAVRRHIPKFRSQERLALGLLKDTLQRNPSGVTALLDQYVGLGQDEQEAPPPTRTHTTLAVDQSHDQRH
ncbi:hypothetical protein [Salana multivorans]